MTGPQRREVQTLLEARAAEAGARVAGYSGWRLENLRLEAHGSRFTAAGPSRLEVECPLSGEHQVDNVFTAIAALHVLGVSPREIQAGIRSARWPGRLERVCEAPDIVLDGAHNPAGAWALARHIQRFYQGRRVRLIYGAMRDKAVTEAAGILFPLAEEILLTSPGHPRAVRPEVIARMVSHPRLSIAASLEEALSRARQFPPEDAVFITGSLYLVGAARARLVQ